MRFDTRLAVVALIVLMWVAAKPQPVAEAAKALAADHVRLVVQNTKAIFPSRCFASYLLVSCGAKKDAELVRPLLDVKAGKDGHWLEYALRGFVLLDPDSGWKHLQMLMAKSGKEGFETRYTYLQTVRFLHEDRPGVVPKRDIERLLAAMLEHSDIADFVIGYLAHWKCWDYTEQILALPQRKTHDIRIIKRSVLRYAMFCPSKECQRYVEEERRRDPDFVRDVEEILKFEMQSAGASNAAK